MCASNGEDKHDGRHIITAKEDHNFFEIWNLTSFRNWPLDGGIGQCSCASFIVCFSTEILIVDVDCQNYFLLSIFCAFFKMNIRCARVSWTKQLKSISKFHASFIFLYKLPYFSRKTWWTCSIVIFFACQKIIKWNTFSIMVFPGLNSVMLLKMKKDTLLGRIINSLPLSNFTLQ